MRPLRRHRPGPDPSLCCLSAIQLQNRLGYDDTLDVFGIHGVAGTGALGLSFFLRSTPAHGVATQLSKAYQTKGVLVSITVSVVVTLVLAWCWSSKTIGPWAWTLRRRDGRHGPVSARRARLRPRRRQLGRAPRRCITVIAHGEVHIPATPGRVVAAGPLLPHRQYQLLDWLRRAGDPTGGGRARARLARGAWTPELDVAAWRALAASPAAVVAVSLFDATGPRC
ncbi:MAG: ammonium transporter [Proteobacteria bacterium]|nr:ammonium transporter [Pseudomonadota bacterium]